MGKVVFIIVFVVVQTAFCQELENLRHCTNQEYKCDFYVSFSDKKMKYEDTLHYYWFKSQKIHVTQGGSEGYELHGPFTKFYHSGQLAEKGEFERGLKDGEWKQWYESGKLMSVYTYNEGELQGDYMLFNEAGDLRESGKIRWSGKKKVKFSLKKDKKPDSLKKKKKKKKKKRWDGVFRPSEEKLKKRKQKKQERIRKREERKKRRKEEGNFIERWVKKLKEKQKKKKDDKKKEKRRESS